MDKRVYLLTLIAFVVGIVELIIGGILDLVAEDLGVSIGQAGLLITMFALVFGISGPVLLYLSGKADRKRLIIIALAAFLAGSILAVFSTSYAVLLVSRIISAASGALLTVLCLTLAAAISKPEYRGRAIGHVVMGISGAIVLGLPLGVSMGHMFGWRSPFILIAVLSILLLIGVILFFGEVGTSAPVPLKQQVAALKDKKIISAHLTTFLFMAGHFTLYGYLTPFVISTRGFDGALITLVYFVYGAAAFSGGGISGISADKFGTKRTLLNVIVLLIACLLTIPFTTGGIFWLLLVVWGILSWSITPPIQSHLVQIAPKTAEIQQSLNNSALHLGIALGTFTGSFVVDLLSIKLNPFIGACFVALSLGTAFVSLQRERSRGKSDIVNHRGS